VKNANKKFFFASPGAQVDKNNGMIFGYGGDVAKNDTHMKQFLFKIIMEEKLYKTNSGQAVS